MPPADISGRAPGSRTVVVQPSRRASDDDQIGLVDPGRDRAVSIAEAVSAGRVGASCSASAHYRWRASDGRRADGVSLCGLDRLADVI